MQIALICLKSSHRGHLSGQTYTAVSGELSRILAMDACFCQLREVHEAFVMSVAGRARTPMPWAATAEHTSTLMSCTTTD